MPPNQKRRNLPTPKEIQPDPNKIMVVYGRNKDAKEALFSFLRALNLQPQEWGQLIKAAANGAPFIGQVLDAGFASTQAVVVLLTPDDEVRLRRSLCDPHDPLFEKQGSYQPRPNVLIEAGMALGLCNNRTIFVRIGEIRSISDIGGRHIINFTGDIDSRNNLAEQLRTAGCKFSANANAWTKELNIPKINPDTSQSVVANSYFDVLGFAKLIHHNFQELDMQGFQKMSAAVRVLFQSQSEGDRPGLIKACEAGWTNSKDTQVNIQKNILTIQKELICRVDGDGGGGGRAARQPRPRQGAPFTPDLHLI